MNTIDAPLHRPQIPWPAILVALAVAACGGTATAPSSPPPAVPSAAASTPTQSAPSPSKAPSAAPSSASLPAGATVLRQVEAPGANGVVIFEHGTLWVEDRSGKVLRQIDESTGKAVRTVHGVLGGYMTYQDGIVWMSSFDLDALLRIDPKNGKVVSIDTGKGQAGTTGVVGSERGVWVANHYLGTIALYDRGGKVLETVKVSPPGISGPQALANDGSNIWVNVPEAREVVAVRITDGKVIHHVPLEWQPSGSLCVGDGRVWVTSAGDGGITAVDGSTGAVRGTPDVGGKSGRCVLAFGSLWFLTFEPNALVRVDPESGAVTGRLGLDDTPSNIAASEGRLWVRLPGKLLEVKPDAT
jgi:streptogramin lyase